jgi:hypothetical protein
MKKYELSEESERLKLKEIIKYFIKSFELEESELRENRVARAVGFKFEAPVEEIQI